MSQKHPRTCLVTTVPPPHCSPTFELVTNAFVLACSSYVASVWRHMGGCRTSGHACALQSLLTLRRLLQLRRRTGHGAPPFQCDSFGQGPGVDLQCGHPCKIPAVEVLCNMHREMQCAEPPLVLASHFKVTQLVIHHNPLAISPPLSADPISHPFYPPLPLSRSSTPPSPSCLP